MTWVVAGRHAFCARAISDVQVTLSYVDGTKRYLNLVRKVHVLTPRITILFADCIRLAFKIVEDLKTKFIPNLDKRLFEHPEVVIEKMARRIRWVYEQLKKDGESVQFIVMVTPKGLLTQFGISKLCSPKFSPASPTKAFEMLEIGSGSNVEQYRDIIERHSVGVFEVEDPNGGLPFLVLPVGRVLSRFIFAEALEYQAAGISHAMHLTVMTPGVTIVEPLPASPGEEFPNVANSWEQLVDLLAKEGISLSSAQALA